MTGIKNPQQALEKLTHHLFKKEATTEPSEKTAAIPQYVLTQEHRYLVLIHKNKRMSMHTKPPQHKKKKYRHKQGRQNLMNL